jgi:hypothetical protein
MLMSFFPFLGAMIRLCRSVFHSPAALFAAQALRERNGNRGSSRIAALPLTTMMIFFFYWILQNVNISARRIFPGRLSS